jgi:hypothetical protein
LAKISLYVFGFRIYFAVEPHYLTLLWISVCINTVIFPEQLPVLLLLVFLDWSIFSFMVLPLFNVPLCCALPTLTYADLFGRHFHIALLQGGMSTEIVYINCCQAAAFVTANIGGECHIRYPYMNV